MSVSSGIASSKKGRRGKEGKRGGGVGRVFGGRTRRGGREDGKLFPFLPSSLTKSTCPPLSPLLGQCNGEWAVHAIAAGAAGWGWEWEWHGTDGNLNWNSALHRDGRDRSGWGREALPCHWRPSRPSSGIAAQSFTTYIPRSLNASCETGISSLSVPKCQCFNPSSSSCAYKKSSGLEGEWRGSSRSKWAGGFHGQ